MVPSPDGDTDFFNIVTGISTIFVYTLPRGYTLNIHRSKKRKWFYIKKGKKQMISLRNYDRCRLHR